MNPKEDKSSIGNLLLDFGIVTPEQLAEAIEYKERSTLEQLLGAVLVHQGYCTREDIDLAMETQKKLRSKKQPKYNTSLISLDAVIRRRTNNSARLAVVEKAERFNRATGEGFTAITEGMLAKSGGK